MTVAGGRSLTIRHHSRISATAVAALWLLSCPVLAQDVTDLRITTAGDETETHVMSLEELDTFDQVEFSTSTIWTDGEVVFTGVALKTLLTEMNATGKTLEMIALNDYAVSIAVDDLEDDAPIVASRMDGKTMSVRDKGPYWVVFPYDEDAKYRTETAYSQSIWQLNRLKLVD